jgi:hypothetical protein
MRIDKKEFFRPTKTKVLAAVVAYVLLHIIAGSMIAVVLALQLAPPLFEPAWYVLLTGMSFLYAPGNVIVPAVKEILWRMGLGSLGLQVVLLFVQIIIQPLYVYFLGCLFVHVREVRRTWARDILVT